MGTIISFLYFMWSHQTVVSKSSVFMCGQSVVYIPVAGPKDGTQPNLTAEH